MATPQLSIRKLDPNVVEKLKHRAKKHGRSLESEIRQILQHVVTESAGTATDSRAEIAAGIRAQFAGKHFSDSTDLVRQDRETR